MNVPAINSISFFNFGIKRNEKPSNILLFPQKSDIFVRENNPSFTGTSAGAPLRRLKNITDPYFGEKMISVADLPKIEKRLDACSTVKKAVHVLKKYKENMLPIELKVFERFEESAKTVSRKTFTQLLGMWYEDAIAKLKIEEFRIIDRIDVMSQQLSPETELKVKEKTTKCRQSLIDSRPETPFKRKNIIASIEEITPKPGEEPILAELKKESYKLPTSGTSENAFIVKYADRSHEEIAKRLIRLSLGTVEHVVPDSLGGENDIKNFLLVSASANSARGNMPFTTFITRFPQVLKNVQAYIEDIIDVIHRGGLQGNQSYPYKIKKTLKTESEGKINLNLSGFKYDSKKAKELEKNSKSSYRLAKKETHRKNRK